MSGNRFVCVWLQFIPREDRLKWPVGASPAVVVEAILHIMEVHIVAFDECLFPVPHLNRSLKIFKLEMNHFFKLIPFDGSALKCGLIRYFLDRRSSIVSSLDPRLVNWNASFRRINGLSDGISSTRWISALSVALLNHHFWEFKFEALAYHILILRLSSVWVLGYIHVMMKLGDADFWLSIKKW